MYGNATFDVGQYLTLVMFLSVSMLAIGISRLKLLQSLIPLLIFWMLPDIAFDVAGVWWTIPQQHSLKCRWC